MFLVCHDSTRSFLKTRESIDRYRELIRWNGGAIETATRTGSVVPEGMLVGNSVVSEVYLEEGSHGGYDFYIYIYYMGVSKNRGTPKS